MSNFNTLKQEGLDSSLYLIKNSNTEEVTFGNTGLSCKSMLDQGIYSPYEVRVTHNGIYMSEDNFNSVKTALGRFKYNNEWVYGLCTDVLFGDLIIGEKMIISNKNGSVSITGDGINITNGSITWSADGSDGVKSPSIQQINGLNEYLTQLDGRIQTFSQTTDPSIDWTTTDLKEQHIGDIWVNPNNGLTKQWTGTKWVEITDSELKKLAESKAQIFTSEPEPPYYVGDLWVQGSNGDILHCKTKRTSGNYNASDWEKSSKYTDDTAWKAWTSDTGDFGKYKKDIQTQLDGKSNCTYGGSTPPSTPETGDLWFCTDSSNGYGTNKAYMYNGSSWVESNGVPDSVWDIADGKSSIFVVKPTKVLSTVDSNFYHKNDIWILESDMTLNGKLYKKGSIMTSTSDSDSFIESHWVEKVRYTDDTTANEALAQAKQGIKDAANALSKANNAYSRAENAETNAKGYADSQDTILSANLTNDYKKYADSKVKDLDDSVSKYLGLGGTTILEDEYIISPYLGGGYLNIASGNKRVIIDPKNLGNTGWIFQVHNDSEISVGIKDNGEAYFKGEITATSGIFTGSIQSSTIKTYLGDYKDLPIDEQGRHYYSQTYEYEEVLYGDIISTGTGTVYLYYDEDCNGVYE